MLDRTLSRAIVTDRPFWISWRTSSIALAGVVMRIV